MPLPWKRHKPSQSKSEETTRSHTEKIAYELSQTRHLLKRPGDQTTDWETAEKIVKSSVRQALYRCNRPFIRLEKTTWEPLLAWANNQALLSLLGLVGNIGLIIAVTTYIASEKHRRNAEVLNAWQTITSAHGQAGSGGRIQALEFLNASPGANWRRRFPWFCVPSRLCLWPAESLDGIDLSVDVSNPVVLHSQGGLTENATGVEIASRVYLRNIQLPGASLSVSNLAGASLWNANLSQADLRSTNLKGASLAGANLTRAFLKSANLEGVILAGANLEGAALIEANLEGAILGAANLQGTYLFRANLEGADLSSVNLEGADLFKTNLTRANLSFVNLAGATLRDANLTGASLKGANLVGVQDLTVEQLSQAKLCSTKLTEGIDLPPDRDCEELNSSAR